MKLRELMTRAPISVAPDDSLLDAARLFLWAEVRHLPVLVADKLVGILSQRDLTAYQFKTRDPDWHNQPVESAMRAPVETAGPDDAVVEAAGRLAERHIGCLPILEDGQLTGIVTTTDLIAAQVRDAARPTPEPANGPLVSEAMTSDPMTVHARDSVLDAAARMQAHRIRHLPVVDGTGKLVGIISDRDVRAAVGDPNTSFSGKASRERLEGMRCGEIMTPNPVSVTPDQACSQVAHLFATVSASAAPVVDSAGQLIGVISYVDLLRVLASTNGVQ